MVSFFGVDYYPEHWPEARWEEDARLMQEMGITAVRLGEFSWVKFEPREGEYHFEWLDRALDVLYRHGIRAILGTPTAAPPAWLIEAHPEYLPVDSHGYRVSFGGRHHDCQSNAGYRAHVRSLVTAMAEHYANHPAVFAWQIDNELGNSHDDLCFCESCTNAFHVWLQKRYGTIDKLNEAWGTYFWSQTYDSFEQVCPPRKNVTSHSPSLYLAWQRFCSDLIMDFFDEQASILRRICPNHLITHNFMDFCEKQNYFDLAKRVDVVGEDRYPTGQFLPGDYPWHNTPAAFDAIRGYKDQNFWMIELESGPTGWETVGETPRPGQLTLWTAASIAHGADSVMWFRWRPCLAGTEQYWHGILPHSGVPGKRYAELKEAIAQLKPVLKDIADVPQHSDVALVLDYDQWWAWRKQPHHPKLDYLKELTDWYAALFQANIPVDFVPPDRDLSKYKLVLAPMQLMVDAEAAAQMKRYVAQGGSLMTTFRCGAKNSENVCHGEGALPHDLTDLFGCELEDFTCLNQNTPLTLQWQNGDRTPGAIWEDELTPTTGTALASASLDGEPFRPVIVENAYGKGHAWYVGTVLESNDRATLVRQMTQAVGIAPIGDSPYDVELHVRPGRTADYLFVLNATSQSQTYDISPDWRPLDANPAPQVSRFGVRIYKKER